MRIIISNYKELYRQQVVNKSNSVVNTTLSLHLFTTLLKKKKYIPVTIQDACFRVHSEW